MIRKILLVIVSAMLLVSTWATGALSSCLLRYEIHWIIISGIIAGIITQIFSIFLLIDLIRIPESNDPEEDEETEKEAQEV